MSSVTGNTGKFHELTINGERVAAFIPAPLPTDKRAVGVGKRATELLARAEQSLTRLDAVLGALSSLAWLGQALARREALASVRIAGNPATLVDLFAHDAGIQVAGTARAKAADEACGILEAFAQGSDEMAHGTGGPLISMRLLNRSHQRLTDRGGAPARTPELLRRGAQARAPGRLRTIPTWIGGTSPGSATYVPPPPFEVNHLLKQLDNFVQHGLSHTLVRIALFQAQFENIHPYLDGNWRLCRVVVALLLEHWKLLRAPVLCLSSFQARHRDDHERLLAAVRSDGDWESWLCFFFEGLVATADDGLAAARSLLELVSQDRDRVLRSPDASMAGVRLFAQLARHPIVNVPMIVKLLETTAPTASKAVELLESLGILEEVSGRQRDRVFSYERFLKLLSSGME